MEVEFENRKQRPVVKTDGRCWRRQEAGGRQMTAGGED
jgi:hypothetical protein